MKRNRETSKPQKKTERQMPKGREREKEQQKRSGRQINRL